MFGWIKYLIHKKIASMKQQEAMSYKYKLSVVYSLASWALFGLVVYSIAKEKAPKLNDGIDYKKLLDIKHTFSIIKFNNFKKLHEERVYPTESNDLYESSEHQELQNVN